MTTPVRATPLVFPMTDPIRATIEAPKRVEGVGELALELVEMAEAASNGSRFGDAHFLKRAADLLAQYHPAPPAEGEVGELVAWLTMLRDHDLRHDAAYAHPTIADHWNDFLTRAAALLAQRHPAPPAPAVVPVAVSERLPRPEDCLDEGWAWFFNPRTGWRRATQPVHSGYTHWLPAHALPLPAGEVQP